RGKVGGDRRRRDDAVFPDDGAGVGEGRGVGNRRPRGDDGRVIAGNIGDEQGENARRGRGGGKTPALDGGKVLPHDVHLADGGAGGKQRTVHRLLVGKRQAIGRQGQERRAA